MTGIDPDRLERRLRWAAEQLGLSPHASPDEIRAAWLRRLPEEDFVPSSELRWALAALLRRQPERAWETRADEAAFAAAEEQLRGEVEAFAERFWDLPADERRRRWQELMDRCAFAPMLRARLRLLGAGLAVDSRIASKDERVIELAAHVRELFVLRPGPRVHARQSILRRMENDKKAWKATARRLRRAYPKLAALGSDLLDKIATAKPPSKRLLKKLRSQPATANIGKQRLPWLPWTVAILAGFSGALVGYLKDEGRSPPTSHYPPLKLPHNPFPPAREDKKMPPEVWQKLKELRPPTKEELKKHIDEEMRRHEREQPELIIDKKDGKAHERTLPARRPGALAGRSQ